jgi:IS30 family transposase
MTPETRFYIESKLRQQHSPEQIAKRMKRDEHWDGPTVSHERIYQHVWQDKAQYGSLYTHLRIAGTKQRRKRRNSRDSRGAIKNRVGIENRPEIVERKIRIGDWEGDTVIGKNHQGALVTLVDRKSKLTLIGKVDRYTAEAVEETIVRLMEALPRRNYTLTVDNGKEFANHQQIADSLMIEFYFANPYHSWERGANENLNGLIRQYFPKKTDFSKITEQQIKQVETKLNNRPRKRHQYKTPIFVMEKLLFNSEVAFMS